MLLFRTMTESEFESFRNFSVENYAKAIFRNLKVTYRQALMMARQESDEVLPLGFYTDDHYFYNLFLEHERDKIGYLWYYINSQRKSAFLYDFYIQPEYRRMGYGKVALSDMEKQLSKKNVKVIRLNVFSDNSVAKEVYKQQGFDTCNEILQKFI